MAFFDDLGKKISSASQSAVQKTKEMAEIAKLNGQISDEEKKLNNYYFQIGKLYVQVHRNDCDAAFAEWVAAVQQSEEKIISCQAMIQELKGIARCANCGAEVPNTAAFCNSCGAPIIKPAQSAPVANQYSAPMTKCSACGADVPANMSFCTSCGAHVGNAAPAPAQVAEKKCPNCGAAVAEGLAFCTECGTNLG